MLFRSVDAGGTEGGTLLVGSDLNGGCGGLRGRGGGEKSLVVGRFLPREFNPRRTKLDKAPAAANSNTQAANGNCNDQIPPKKTRAIGCWFCQKKTAIAPITTTKINKRILAKLPTANAVILM